MFSNGLLLDLLVLDLLRLLILFKRVFLLRDFCSDSKV